MTTDPSLSQRVTRLENDTESIYELLIEMRSTQAKHTGRFDRLEDTLSEHSNRFDRLESTLAEVVRRLPDPS